MIYQRRNKRWLAISKEWQFGWRRIQNVSNSFNHICFPVFHVPNSERVIKANSLGMKITLLGMCGLNVTCVRGVIKRMPVETWNKTYGLIKNQWRLGKKWKWLTLKGKNSLLQNWGEISVNWKVNGSILKKMIVFLCFSSWNRAAPATWEKVAIHIDFILLLRDTDSV